MTPVFWLIGGLFLAAALIAIAIVRVGNDHEYHDPYDGEGW